MVRLTVDESLQEQLKQLSEQAELCDESGNRLGYYVPEALHHRLLYDWAKAQVSDGELERARQEPGGSSLAEIWARMGRT
ncbi:MAG: hypothetical protein ACT4QC_02525 [Planctomycetaceae bacterium]